MNVQAYGAIGDGVTDDTAAIRAAFAATGWPGRAGCVEFEPLRYLISGTLTLDAGSLPSTPPMVIKGNGASLVTATQKLTFLEVTDAAVSETWLSVNQLHFRLNARGCRGVHLHNAEASEFVGCLFSDALSLGVELSGTSTSNRFVSCTFSNLARGILISGGGHNTLISGCGFIEQLLGDAQNPALNWIEVAGQTDGLMIVGCEFRGTRASLPVVRLSGSRNGLISGCIFRRSDDWCVEIGANGAGDPNQVIGCSFTDNMRGGVHVAGGSKNVIGHCLFGKLSQATPKTDDAVLIERKFAGSASGVGNVVSGCVGTDGISTRFLVNEGAGATGNVVTGCVSTAGAGLNLSAGTIAQGNGVT